MINIKRMITAFVAAIVVFYVLLFVLKTVIVLLIGIPIFIGILYFALRYLKPNNIRRKSNIEEMDFEELD